MGNGSRKSTVLNLDQLYGYGRAIHRSLEIIRCLSASTAFSLLFLVGFPFFTLLVKALEAVSPISDLYISDGADGADGVKVSDFGISMFTFDGLVTMLILITPILILLEISFRILQKPNRFTIAVPALALLIGIVFAFCLHLFTALTIVAGVDTRVENGEVEQKAIETFPPAFLPPVVISGLLLVLICHQLFRGIRSSARISRVPFSERLHSKDTLQPWWKIRSLTFRAPKLSPGAFHIKIGIGALLILALYFESRAIVQLLGTPANIQGHLENIELNDLPASYALFSAFHVLFFLALYQVNISIASFLRRRTRRWARLQIDQLKDSSKKPPILFLRPFRGEDKPLERQTTSCLDYLPYVNDGKSTFEDLLVEDYSDQGPVIAIGNPRDSEQPHGAVREYVKEGGDWQESVLGHANRASKIVILISATPGTLWEVNLVTDPGMIEKTLFFLPANLRQRSAGIEEFKRILLEKNSGVDVSILTENTIAFRLLPTGEVLVVTSSVFDKSAYQFAQNFLFECDREIGDLANIEEMKPAPFHRPVSDNGSGKKNWVELSVKFLLTPLIGSYLFLAAIVTAKGVAEIPWKSLSLIFLGFLIFGPAFALLIKKLAVLLPGIIPKKPISRELLHYGGFLVFLIWNVIRNI